MEPFGCLLYATFRLPVKLRRSVPAPFLAYDGQFSRTLSEQAAGFKAELLRLALSAREDVVGPVHPSLVMAALRFSGAQG